MIPSVQCPFCFSTIPAESTRCPGCGMPIRSLGYQPTPLFSAVPSVSPFSSDQTERVLKVIGMITRKTGVFSCDLYHLVITPVRMIFAFQSNGMQAAEKKNALEKAKSEGKNLLTQIEAQKAARSGDKYLGMAPELILSESLKNFSIPLDRIESIHILYGDWETNSSDALEINTTAKTFHFHISNPYNVTKQLKEALGDKVK